MASHRYHTGTGETSWNPPGNEATTDDPDGVTDVLPVGWVRRKDAASGGTYYYNETSGETTWERPSVGGAESVAQIEKRRKTGQMSQSSRNAADSSASSVRPSEMSLGSAFGSERSSSVMFSAKNPIGTASIRSPPMSPIRDD